MYWKDYFMTPPLVGMQTLLTSSSLALLAGLLTHYWPHWADCWRPLWP